MKKIINKSIGNGVVNAQPSKSYAHRLLIAACLSDEKSIIDNVVLSNDICATINCIKALGREIEIVGEEIKKIIIKEKKANVLNDQEEVVFDCLESGSTLRFFIPIALLLNKKVVFKGTPKLISRGIQIYEDICAQQNIEITKEEDKIIFKGSLKADYFQIVGNISSQFISGLLFALPLLKGDSCISLTTSLESSNYVDITIDVLKLAGIVIENKNGNYYIIGEQKYNGLQCAVEGDYSNSAFLAALNYFGGNVSINGLNKDSYQGDKRYIELFEKLNKKYTSCDIKNCIDLGPILFCFASLKHGGCFTGVNRLRIKESDRIGDIKKELKKFNIDVVEEVDKVIIKNENIQKPSEVLNGHNDHRIVMALSVMLTVFGGEIDGVEAVSKSYPNFFDDLKLIGVEVIDVTE